MAYLQAKQEKGVWQMRCNLLDLLMWMREITKTDLFTRLKLKLFLVRNIFQVHQMSVVRSLSICNLNAHRWKTFFSDKIYSMHGKDSYFGGISLCYMTLSAACLPDDSVFDVYRKLLWSQWSNMTFNLYVSCWSVPSLNLTRGFSKDTVYSFFLQNTQPCW